MPIKTIPRVATGVPRLDFLLDGGFYEGGLYVIQGQPGMGKTILANQFCYHRASLKEHSTYISLLAESTGRMISYLSRLSFVDQESVGTLVQYVNGYQQLKDKKFIEFMGFIRQILKEHKSRVLIIDGIDLIRSAAGSENEYREFLHALQAFSSLIKCTTLLLMPVAGDGNTVSHEHATSDGVIDIREWRYGVRAVREVQILKMRGSNYLKGGHEIEITKDGFIIHPRTEVQFARPQEGSYEEGRTRMAFGIKELDKMLHGGLLSGSLTTLFGTPGTGKTSLGLSFLIEGSKRGEHGIYFGFYETPPRLIEKALGIGLDLGTHVKNGGIELMWQPAVENIADALAERLLERIREKKHQKVRVFIDGMSGFRRAMAYSERFGSFLSALSNELRSIGATTLYSEETEFFSSAPELPNRELGSVVDNVIFLRYFELRSQLHRLISILKVRESAYEPEIREFSITGKGLKISDSFDSAESLLTGHARIMSTGIAKKKKAPAKPSLKSRKR